MEITKEKIVTLAERFTVNIEAHISLLEGKRAGEEAYTERENIESGLPGMVIFLDELYRYTGNAQWKQLLERSEHLLLWLLETQPGFDWSLYKGKAGIIFALLRAGNSGGLTSTHEKILAAAAESEKDFLHTEYVSDSLYDGRSGTLLMLFQLYNITKSNTLPPLITRYINAILDNAKYTNEGMYWVRNEEVQLRPSCGIAYGVSGIRYALSVINNSANNKALDFAIRKIKTYQDNCRIETLQNWGNYERGIRTARELELYTTAYANGDTTIFEPADDTGYQSGTTGICMANIAAGQDNNDTLYFQALLDKLQHTDLDKADTDLLNGISGTGMLLISNENKGPTGSLSREIVTAVYNQTEKKCNNKTHDTRLLSGDLGAMYFLLRTLDEESGNHENILLPLSGSKDISGTGFLKLDLYATRKKMLGKTFFRTLGILESEKPDAFRDFCDNDPDGALKNEITRFAKYTEAIISELHLKGNPALLQDAYTLERKKNDFFAAEQRTGVQFFLDKMEAKKQSIDFLNQPDETILSCKTGMSRSFTIVKTKWNWSFQKDMQYEAISSMPDKPFEYLFYFSAEMKRTEAPLNLMSVVMHQFDTPMRIADVIDGLKAMLRTLPHAILFDYAAAAGSSTVADFFDRLDYLLLAFIKQMIYEGFLETQNIAYEIII